MDKKTDKFILASEHLMSCLAISPCGKFLLVNLNKQEQVACVTIAIGRITATFKGIRDKGTFSVHVFLVLRVNWLLLEVKIAKWSFGNERGAELLSSWMDTQVS